MKKIFFDLNRRFLHCAALFALSAGLLTGGCVSSSPTVPSNNASIESRNGKVARIGFLLETLKEERWGRDKEAFEQRARELGAEVETQVADGSDAAQLQQAENLLTKGIDVLVVVPHNGEVAASIVEAAKRRNVPVIAYDRLILNSDVALYISFDNVRVGEMQARYLIERAPHGNYVLICGSPTDNNAKLFYQGQMNILKPAVDKGDIKIVAEQWSNNWQASEALRHTENALTQNNDNIVAVLAAADSVAHGVVQALEARNLTGKILVSGQDADLTASRDIVAGKQTMTIYKPIKPLASVAAESAVKLARGEKIETSRTINNGLRDVPAILLDPIIVDRANLEEVIIRSGFQKREEVFQNIPSAK